MTVEKSFQTFCKKNRGSFSKQKSKNFETYFCQFTKPLTVDALLFGRKADENKYKIFLVHFGRSKVLEIDEKDTKNLEVRIDDIEPAFIRGEFSESDQYVVYATKDDIELTGIEMRCDKNFNECFLSFIPE